jgi:hypothetical protein
MALANIRDIFSKRKTLILTIIIILLLFGTVYFGTSAYFLKQRIDIVEKQLNSQGTNGKIVSFLSLFIEKVLENNSEVSFEDRLQLENSVRDLNDSEVLTVWQNFTQAQTSDDVQKYCKELLDILVSKISG